MCRWFKPPSFKFVACTKEAQCMRQGNTASKTKKKRLSTTTLRKTNAVFYIDLIDNLNTTLCNAAPGADIPTPKNAQPKCTNGPQIPVQSSPVQSLCIQKHPIQCVLLDMSNPSPNADSTSCKTNHTQHRVMPRRNPCTVPSTSETPTRPPLPTPSPPPS